MAKMMCSVKNAEITVPEECGECMYLKGKTCVHPGAAMACTGITCIWCYLVKEGVKKASAGIRKWKANQAK